MLEAGLTLGCINLHASLLPNIAGPRRFSGLGYDRAIKLRGNNHHSTALKKASDTGTDSCCKRPCLSHPSKRWPRISSNLLAASGAPLVVKTLAGLEPERFNRGGKRKPSHACALALWR